jgi:predicted SAM-dependent methyltransferase
MTTHQPSRKLHLACGPVHLEGWRNIDLFWRPGVNVIWNLKWGIPYASNSCDFLYHEHFIEHLTPSEALRLHRSCLRVLKPGGVLRIATPSLRHIVGNYLGDWRDQDWLRWPAYRHVATGAEMMNMLFRAWGHQWVYDEAEMERRLREAGFSDIRFVERSESAYPDLRGIESRKDSLLVCEATKKLA